MTMSDIKQSKPGGALSAGVGDAVPVGLQAASSAAHAASDGAQLPMRRGSNFIARAKLWLDLRTLGPLGAVVVSVVVFGLLDNNFLTTPNALNILRQIMVLLVVALGSTFIIMMGSIDISHAAVMSLAGMSGAFLMNDHGQWAVLLAVPIGVVAGAVNGLIFAYLRLPSFLVTLGTSFVIGGIALTVSGGTSVSVPIGTSVGSIFGGEVWGGLPTAAFWAIGLTLVCILVAARTKFGRYMYAIGGGEAVARLSGVPVRRYKLFAFIVAGGLSGFAGLLLLFHLQGGDATMADSFLLPAIAAVVIGGTPLTGGLGGPARTLLGVTLVAILENGMDLAGISPFNQQIIFGSFVIVAVIVTMDRKRISVMK